tara:strand:- start:96 stop:497 length:402 start_codon:yes stop_codon:yes gene_type:complete
MATSRYFLFQNHTHLPVPYRPDARAMTSDLNGDPSFALFALASERRPNHRPALVQRAEQRQALRPGSLWDRGVRWIVVHRDLERGQEGTAITEEILEALYGKPKVFATKAIFTVSPKGSEVAPRDAWIQRLSE